jgi:hypothetical protein
MRMKVTKMGMLKMKELTAKQTLLASSMNEMDASSQCVVSSCRVCLDMNRVHTYN